jgi:putative component of membrane protein insertase Oxa1/YidC/SpoIIIJ protein YidD
MLSKNNCLPFLVLVRFYQVAISLLHLQLVDFNNCSSYMIEALQTHGLFYGGFLGISAS